MEEKQKSIKGRPRIVHINQALSKMYGEELKELAIDMIKFKEKLYERLKDTMEVEALKTFLENKIGNYMKTEYDNKYGKLERWESEDKDEETVLKKRDFEEVGEGGVESFNHFGGRLKRIREVNKGLMEMVVVDDSE